MAEHGGVSPVTGEVLETRALMRNAALQAVIDDLFPRVEPRDLAIPEQSVAGSLPLELLIMIAGHLTNQDLISCVQVSYQPNSAVAIFPPILITIIIFFFFFFFFQGVPPMAPADICR